MALQNHTICITNSKPTISFTDRKSLIFIIHIKPAIFISLHMFATSLTDRKVGKCIKNCKPAICIMYRKPA